MQVFAIIALIAAAVVASAANAQGIPPDQQNYVKNQAVFCEGTYALCIKAHCTPIPTIDRLGNYSYREVSCTCEIENGWSMGPGQCGDRIPVKSGHFVYMISTYSNLFNATNATLSCDSDNTKWALCYGAPCVADERAVEAGKGDVACTCPIRESKMRTLGGDCAQESCSTLWSAATPEADTFANQHFAEFMQQHGYPHLPPAQMCANITRSPR